MPNGNGKDPESSSGSVKIPSVWVCSSCGQAQEDDSCVRWLFPTRNGQSRWLVLCGSCLEAVHGVLAAIDKLVQLVTKKRADDGRAEEDQGAPV